MKANFFRSLNLGLSFILFFSFFCTVSAQKTTKKTAILQSGPVQGYAEMKEAVIWLQTRKESSVYIEYWNIKEPSKRLRSEISHSTRHNAFAVTVILDQVQPGTTYDYNVYVGKKKVGFDFPTRFTTQTDWKFKNNPPDFTAVFGSCTYINETITDRPGIPYGGDYQIFQAIVDKKPDLMLWGGDNIYLRPADWTSRTGFIHRYSHTRAAKELEKLLALCPNFAVWDDHDFGPNDSNGSYVLKEIAHEMFDLFWPNPPSVEFPEGKSVCTAFEFNGIDFFTLDNRSFKTEILNDSTVRQIFGKNQLEWLINNLKYSPSPFKMVIVGGQILNDGKVFENLANYPEERKYLLKRIEEENIKGVVFLSGDRHHSELSVYTNAKGNTLWDVTSSPITSGLPTGEREKNSYRIEGSLIQQRNFTTLSFSGNFKDRVLTVTWYDSDGKLLYQSKLYEKDIYK